MRGGEEISRQINLVLEALISRVHEYRGSVLGFAGDSITCWFDGPDVLPAATCAFALQETMKQFASVFISPGVSVSLSIKVAFEHGFIRRFTVGDPAQQIVDVIGGSTLDRMAAGESLARSNEVISGPAAVEAASKHFIVQELRTGADQTKYALLAGLRKTARPNPWPPLTGESFPEDQLASWIQPPVYAKFQSVTEAYFADLRNTTSLFLKICGLDYDNDPEVTRKLDTFIRWAQEILDRYTGTLIQLSTGDKGTYLNIGFGAPVAHGDDQERALAAALALINTPPELDHVGCMHIGLSWGQTYSGNLGGRARRSYAAMGREVNIAARLMDKANDRQILLSDRLYPWAQRHTLSDQGEILLKGVQNPLRIYSLLGEGSHAPGRHRIAQNGSIIGRESERTVLKSALENFGGSQRTKVVVLEGEAGIGKSHLLQGLLSETRKTESTLLLGSGDSIERRAAYHAWWSIFRSIFDLEPGSELNEVRDSVRARIHAMLPDQTQRLPLINSVLPTDFPDNEWTAPMQGKVRADNTLAFLVSILRAFVAENPLVLVMDDLHWLDTASWSLLTQVRESITPQLLVIATRPLFDLVSAESELSRFYQVLLDAEGVERLLLDRLSRADTLALVSQRLGVSDLPTFLGEVIYQRGEGHPFFSEELAYALRDRGVISVHAGEVRSEPSQADLSNLDFPDTLQGLILSRVDLLSLHNQLVLKVGSVIGRLFPYHTLRDVYPVPEERESLKMYLREIEARDITLEETPEPDLAYIFKHILTQEVVYNLMTFDQRKSLHRELATWIEGHHADELGRYYPILAHHWQRADVVDQAIFYLDKAGELALKDYANEEAIEFLTQALALQNEHSPSERGSLQQARWEGQIGEAYYRLGRLEESAAHLKRSLAYLNSPVPEGTPSFVQGVLRQLFAQIGWRLKKRRDPEKGAGDPGSKESDLLSFQSYARFSEVSFLDNNTNMTVFGLISSLNAAEPLGPSPELATAYGNMCAAAGLIPVHGMARAYRELALRTIETVDDPIALADVLWSVCVYSSGIGAWERTERELKQAIDIFEKYGNWPRWGLCMEMLIRLNYARGHYSQMVSQSREFQQVAERRKDLVHQSWAVLDLIEGILLLEDDLDEAIRQAYKVLDLTAASQEVGSTIKAHALLATALLRSGDLEGAETSADRALVLMEGSQPTSFGLLAQYFLANLVYLSIWERGLPGIGRPIAEKAQSAQKQMQAFARTFPIGKPRYLLIQGISTSLLGKTARGEALLRSSIEEARTFGIPYDEAAALLELGRRLPSGHPDRQPSLEKAAALFTGLETPFEHNQTQQAIGLLDE